MYCRAIKQHLKLLHNNPKTTSHVSEFRDKLSFSCALCAGYGIWQSKYRIETSVLTASVTVFLLKEVFMVSDTHARIRTALLTFMIYLISFHV